MREISDYLECLKPHFLNYPYYFFLLIMNIEYSLRDKIPPVYDGISDMYF